MKTMIKLFAICYLPSAICFSAYAQGSLTPPGLPAPTMKTADQIEPRTIVNAVNTPGNANNLFIITNSGSYYLTTNLVGVSGKNGIEIATNDVTLDLNSFALQGVSDSWDGIAIVGYGIDLTNITVRNGTISGWGGNGVDCFLPSGGSRSFNTLVERLNVSACNSAINVSAGVVRDCNCQNNSEGINVIAGTVTGCFVQNIAYVGILVYSDSSSGLHSGSVSGCYVQNCGQSGIRVQADGAAVIGNTCIGNNSHNVQSDAGIFIQGSNNRVEDNHVSASGYAGILVSSGGNNLIIKNSVSGNGLNNYTFSDSQIVGPLITNTVSGIITNSNPWANFSF